MWAKKGLLITLVVALVILAVSLAIGRPPWQAALFSIAFFLMVALIFGSRGFIIPEALWERGFSRKPPEAGEKDDKAEFFGRMESALDELSTGATAEGVQWMTDYMRVMRGVLFLRT